MKAWGKTSCKHFCSSGSTSEAVTPVVGSLLMLLILVVLAGAVSSIIFNGVGEDANFQTPMAKITLESCEGGLRYATNGENATFENNMMVLMHKGGTPLSLDTTCIKISGDGNAYQGDVADGGIIVKGSTEVIYQNLSPTGKNPKYKDRNKAVLEDDFWGVGEKLIICGNDSAVSSIDSSVKVSVNGDSNTSDNYGFKVGSEITVRVIDVKSSNVIAQQRAIVKHID